MTTSNPPLIVLEGQEPVSNRKMKAQLRAQDAKTKLSSPWASGIAILIAVLIVLILLLRPQGLFGRSVERA